MIRDPPKPSVTLWWIAKNSIDFAAACVWSTSCELCCVVVETGGKYQTCVPQVECKLSLVSRSRVVGMKDASSALSSGVCNHVSGIVI